MTVYIEYGRYVREMRWRGGSAKRARGCLNGEDHQLIDGPGVAPRDHRWAAARHWEEEKGGEATADTARAAIKKRSRRRLTEVEGLPSLHPGSWWSRGKEQRWRDGEVEVNIPLWRQTASLAGRQCSNPPGLLTPPRWQPAARFSWHTQTHSEREGERAQENYPFERNALEVETWVQ